MKLLGVRLSPFVRKVAVVLAVKGLDYEHESVMPGSDDPKFRAASPTGKIPGFVDGDLSLADSTVICEYLEDKYPEPAVMPKDVGLRARARFLEEYGDSKLVETASVIFIEKFLTPTSLAKRPTWNGPLRRRMSCFRRTWTTWRARFPRTAFYSVIFVQPISVS